MVANCEANPWTVELFPFESKLQNFQTNNETVLLVDIGGGKGHVTAQIRALISQLPGKLILQVRPEVLADIIEPLPGVEKMEYDFFTHQQVQGTLAGSLSHLAKLTNYRCTERTEPQWEKVLDESGFKLHKIYREPGTNFTAIEVYLK